MVTRRDLIKLGVAAATSAGYTQVARAGSIFPGDADVAMLESQQSAKPKPAPHKPRKLSPRQIINGDPFPPPSPAVVNPVFRTSVRGFQSLDGEWDFALDPKSIGLEEEWFTGSGPFDRKIQVPGTWPTQEIGEPGMSHPTHLEGYAIPLRNQYVGSGWYKKVIRKSPDWMGKKVWLKIGGVNSQGWFWINGKYIGELYRSCGAYKFDISTHLDDGDNTIVFWVSNQVPSKKGLLNWIDQFGGCYRSIELETTATTYIDEVWARPDFANQRAEFTVKIFAAPDSACKFNQYEFVPCTLKPVSGNYRLHITVTTLSDSKEAGKAQFDFSEIAQTGTEVSLPISLDPFRPWSPEDRALYRADLVLERDGQTIDAWVERFGVRSIERRGADIFLNGKKIFLSGFGDDYVYPLTVASPPSREEHLKHLNRANAYGFNFVRHHTHIETPEYFEAAEEAGIMIQAALSYEGSRPAVVGSCYSPCDDLNELVQHYRRYVSLIIYCMGNEGLHYPETRRSLYRLAKMLDPTRLVRAQDGVATDYEGISDIHGGPIGANPIEQEEIVENMPVILHEYLNLSAPPDYRLAPLFKGAEASPYTQKLDRPEQESGIPSDLFVNTQPKLLAGSDIPGATDSGISQELAERVIEGGQELQSIYQKIGLERARSTKGVTGYNYWTIVDVSAVMPQGLLDPFWGEKRSKPEFFRQFNNPVVLLLPDLSPYGTDRVFTSGSKLSLPVACSNYSSSDLHENVSWTLAVDGKTLSQGKLENSSIPQGGITGLGKIEFAMPDVVRPSEVWLTLRSEGEKYSNSWQFYCFPKSSRHIRALELFAAPSIHDAISKQYPNTRLFTAGQRPSSKDLLFADKLDAATLKFLADGGVVFLLNLSDFSPVRPGIRVGWWGPSEQRGTAMAASKAFGDFPGKDGVPTFALFNLLQDAALLRGPLLNRVDPLMVTLSKMAYSASVFETRVGSGRLFATGLNLLSGSTEASWLLDQFVAYTASHDFAPQRSITLAGLQEAIGQNAAALRLFPDRKGSLA